MNPGATEVVADSVDNDCDTFESCYEDLDGDTYGTATTVASVNLACTDAGESILSNDCDDVLSAVNPGATEVVANGIYNDCDTFESCYEDLDGDTYGTSATISSVNLVCTDAGESILSTDCDDVLPAVNPGATELIADGVDNDCDTFESCYEDLDGDTYGTVTTVSSVNLVCTDAGESTVSTDCDDVLSAVNPGATELIADGVDNDCDTFESCYQDSDGDTYGTATTVSSVNLVCTDAGESTLSTDCDDVLSAVNPGATETDRRRRGQRLRHLRELLRGSRWRHLWHRHYRHQRQPRPVH